MFLSIIISPNKIGNMYTDIKKYESVLNSDGYTIISSEILEYPNYSQENNWGDYLMNPPTTTTNTTATTTTTNNNQPSLSNVTKKISITINTKNNLNIIQNIEQLKTQYTWISYIIPKTESIKIVSVHETRRSFKK